MQAPPSEPTLLINRRRMRQIAQVRQLRATRRAGAASRRSALALGAAVLALGSATAGALLTLRPDPTPDGAASAPPPARVVPVDAAAVSASASSTQSPDGDITYAAANTLDGDPATAWNSNGTRDGAGPGISLTYTFAEPLTLQGVTVRNGYQKVRPRAGRSPLDLYPVNSRVRRLRVVTDAGSWFWDLTDTRPAQTFAAAAGRTASVRLEIVSVYPSGTYPDVAISEVAFTAALAPARPAGASG